MRFRRMATLVTAVAVLIALAAAPVHADPPVEVEEPIFFIFPDLENGFAVFWNITRDDFCAWAATQPPPPTPPTEPPPVIELVPASLHETGQGALVASFQAERPIELWQFDSDVPPLDTPCTDTDDQLGAWATGSAWVSANDNDLDVSGTRTNSFGDRGTGTVHNVEGAWHYSWVFQAQCVEDCEADFTLRVANPNLKKKGK